MGPLEFKGEAGLTLLRKQFPDTWQALLRQARQMITQQRNQMKGVVSVQMAATACIMRNKPALSIMAAAYVMAREELLLQEHIDLELDILSLQEQVKALDPEKEPDRISFYEAGIETKQERVSEILEEITTRALTMGGKPHTFPKGSYSPPRWESGKGFLQA